MLPRIAAGSASWQRQTIRSRMAVGGSVASRTMAAVPRRAPPIRSIACAVVETKASMLARVPGPAVLAAMRATRSPRCTGVTRATAAIIGIAACPPQVTMLMLGASRCSARFTVGTQNGPIAAGVRSITRLPSATRASECRRWAPAEVASKTIRISP